MSKDFKFKWHCYHCTDAYNQQAYYFKRHIKVAGETELLNNITALFDSGASCASRFSTIKKLSFSDNLIMFFIQRWLQGDICVFGGEPPAIGLQNNRGLEQYGHVQFSESWILLLGLYQDVWNSVWQLNSVIRNSILLLTDMKYIYWHNVLIETTFQDKRHLWDTVTELLIRNNIKSSKALV